MRDCLQFTSKQSSKSRKHLERLLGTKAGKKQASQFYDWLHLSKQDSRKATNRQSKVANCKYARKQESINQAKNLLERKQKGNSKAKKQIVSKDEKNDAR